MEKQKIKDFFYYVGMSILTGNPKGVERNMELKKKIKNLDSEIAKNKLTIYNIEYANPRLN